MKQTTSKSPPNEEQLNKLLAEYAAAGGDVSMLSAGGKNAAAVALGRQGGLKGGRARAERLSSEERRAIALKAATARWGTKEKPSNE